MDKYTGVHLSFMGSISEDKIGDESAYVSRNQFFSFFFFFFFHHPIFYLL